MINSIFRFWLQVKRMLSLQTVTNPSCTTVTLYRAEVQAPDVFSALSYWHLSPKITMLITPVQMLSATITSAPRRREKTIQQARALLYQTILIYCIRMMTIFYKTRLLDSMNKSYLRLYILYC